MLTYQLCYDIIIDITTTHCQAFCYHQNDKITNLIFKEVLTLNDLTKKIIGTILNELLAEKGILQKELAEHIGVTPNTVSYYLSGDRCPDIDKIIEIAKYLNVSTDYLLGITDVKSTDTELQSVCNYTGLSENAIQTIKTYYNLTKQFAEETIVILDSNFDKKTFSNPKIVFEIFNFFISNSSFWEAISAAANYKVSLSDWVKDVSKFIREDLTLLIDKSKDADSFSVKDLTESELFSLFNKISDLIHYQQRLVNCNIFESVEFFKKSIEEFTEELKAKQDSEKSILNSVENFIGVELYELKGVKNDGEQN